MNNKKNNKGFSLVELIVVVAIMAVLVGVLAPAYLRYVEKTRLQKDVSAVSEVVSAIKVAAADANVSSEITTTGLTVKVTNGATPTVDPATTNDYLQDELDATIGAVALTSDDLSSGGATISVKKDANGNLEISVTGGSKADWTNVK